MVCASVHAFRRVHPLAADLVREGIDQTGDAVTADILTGFSRGLDKALWLIEAHGGKATPTPSHGGALS